MSGRTSFSRSGSYPVCFAGCFRSRCIAPSILANQFLNALVPWVERLRSAPGTIEGLRVGLYVRAGKKGSHFRRNKSEPRELVRQPSARAR